MTKTSKILQKILTGLSDANIPFSDLINLLIKLGFTVRINGSHYIFSKNEVKEIINLQQKNGFAKPYQIKQVRELIIKYGLNKNADEQR
ncbi:MAG: type II toxin-antitoxin system HicA family toxin [Flavobacteriales bacterium]|nr:type II toxin-antitoxin system HicA family toxin [Flavobacteriales bacterium]